MIVPVLSSTIVRTACAVSSAAPPLIRTPRSAPAPVPTITAVGVASPMAQGQAMISTVTKAMRAKTKAGCGPRSNQSTKAAMAIEITTGVKTPAITSASRWIGAREACASCTSRTICASAVSAPTFVAS